VISLRGSVIPVIDLARFMGIVSEAPERCSTLMVTEFCGRIQGFLVSDVDRIARVDWDQVKSPEHALTGTDSMVTASPVCTTIASVDPGCRVILAKAFGEPLVPNSTDAGATDLNVLLDDPPADQIANVLDRLGVRYQRQPAAARWEKLAQASQAQSEVQP
jgi:two-component system chemotaxis response regulator CheV